MYMLRVLSLIDLVMRLTSPLDLQSRRNCSIGNPANSPKKLELFYLRIPSCRPLQLTRLKLAVVVKRLEAPALLPNVSVLARPEHHTAWNRPFIM